MLPVAARMRLCEQTTYSGEGLKPRDICRAETNRGMPAHPEPQNPSLCALLCLFMVAVPWGTRGMGAVFEHMTGRRNGGNPRGRVYRSGGARQPEQGPHDQPQLARRWSRSKMMRRNYQFA